MVDQWAWPPRLRHSSRTKRETRDRRVKLNIWDVDGLGRAGEGAVTGPWRGREGAGDANVKEMSRAVHEHLGIPVQISAGAFWDLAPGQSRHRDIIGSLILEMDGARSRIVLHPFRI